MKVCKVLVAIFGLHHYLYSLTPSAADMKSFTAIPSLSTEAKLTIINLGAQQASARYNMYAQQLPRHQSLPSKVLYTIATVLTYKVAASLADPAWLKRALLYNKELLAKKEKIRKLQSERAIHEHNIKVLSARLALIKRDQELTAGTESLLKAEIMEDHKALEQLKIAQKEYETLKKEKLGHKKA